MADVTKHKAFYEAAQQVMCNLWGRWQDEMQYEEISEYAAPLRPIAEKAGVEIVRMTKTPFGCVITDGAIEVHVTVTGRRYRMRETKASLRRRQLKPSRN